jgi:hypothetical protein
MAEQAPRNPMLQRQAEHRPVGDRDTRPPRWRRHANRRRSRLTRYPAHSNEVRFPNGLREDGFSCLIVRVGGRFWLGLVAAVIGIGIAAFLVFLLIEEAFLQWGVIGALIFFTALALIVSWFHDRRVQARWDEGESEA